MDRPGSEPRRQDRLTTRMRPQDLPCPAPDRTPLAPRTLFPGRACDTHAHICGPAAAFPYAEERIYTPPDSTLTDYLHLLEVLGVERAVLVQPSVYGNDNRALLDALALEKTGLSSSPARTGSRQRPTCLMAMSRRWRSVLPRSIPKDCSGARIGRT